MEINYLCTFKDYIISAESYTNDFGILIKTVNGRVHEASDGAFCGDGYYEITTTIDSLDRQGMDVTYCGENPPSKPKKGGVIVCLHEGKLKVV